MVRQRKKARVSAASGASANTIKTESNTSDKKKEHRDKRAKAEKHWARFNDDNPHPGFKVNGPSRKKASEAEVQPNPWPEIELRTVRYTVEPKIDWESLVRFKNVQRSAETNFSVGDTVFVRPDEDQWSRGDEAVEYWLARILEVRGATSPNVFLRVYWLYRPEDLPQGRQPYHGDCELIVSNHMDIIEATMVEDVAPVAYWSEQPDQSDWPAQDQLFFRQSIDFLEGKPKRLSNLRHYCRDKAPCNPDEPLVNCDGCNGWLHARCLEEQAVINAMAQHQTSQSKSDQKNSKKRKRPLSSANHDFTARLKTGHNDTIYLTVSDHRSAGPPTHYNVDVICLLCNTCIEPARDFKMGTGLDGTKDAGDNESRIRETIEVDPSALYAQFTPAPSSHAVQEPKRRGAIFKNPKASRRASDVSNGAEETPKPEPRRRGRPRKKAVASMDVVGDAEPGGSGPRRRGRPRKNAVVSKDAVSATPLELGQKRRGRPPKRPEALGDIVGATPGGLGPKRRGRPPKTVMVSREAESTEAYRSEAENIEVDSPRTDDALANSAMPEPAPAQISTPQPPANSKPYGESVLQSGFKSVKRLIWGE